VAECFSLTVEAFNLSEAYRTPVILLSGATIGHMREAGRGPGDAALRRDVEDRGPVPC
jgi:2-oxoglutarate ferredoxin oxidoreductase subunit alpha